MGAARGDNTGGEQGMKIWLLKNREDLPEKEADNPWYPWYDKIFGQVVRAETEQQARQIATEQAADEAKGEFKDAWLNSQYSTCVELSADGEPGVILRDHAKA
jgi:hypothetical protein